MTIGEKIVLSNLLKEISDSSLQTILRKVIFNGDNVIDTLLEQRPELKITGISEYEKTI